MMERVLRRRGKLSVSVYGLLHSGAQGKRDDGCVGVFSLWLAVSLTHCQPLPAVDGSQTIVVLVVVLTTIHL